MSKEYTAKEDALYNKRMRMARGNRNLRVKLYHKASRGGQQAVATPIETVCKPMIGLLDNPQDLIWIVCYNIEFIDSLIYDYNVPSKNIVYLFDCEAEAALAMDLYQLPACNLHMLPQISSDNVNEFSTVIQEALNIMALNKDDAIIIGNVPFHEMDGGNQASAKPLYHKFIEQAIDSGVRYVSMVVPSRWMAGGKGLDKFRARMMVDKSLKVIRDFRNDKDVFPNVSIQGGVCYFVRDSKYMGNCSFNGDSISLSKYPIVLRDSVGRSIVQSIEHSWGALLFEGNVSPSKPYGFRGDTLPSNSGIPCYFKQSVGKGFVDQAMVTDTRNDMNTWRVVTARASNEGASFKGGLRRVTSTTMVIEPGSVCSETYIVCGSFVSQMEADNLKSYMSTKFFRYLLFLAMVSQDITRTKFAFVPDLKDYTKPWTDEELFAKFNLSQEQVDHIKATIKEI